MTQRLEKRPYGPESTPEELRLIEERISLLEPDLVLYREVPVMSTFQFEVFERRLRELGDRKGYRLLVDLSESDPPPAALRARIRDFFLKEPITKAALFTERNMLINIAAKFVVAGIGFKSWTIHKTREEAIAAIKA